MNEEELFHAALDANLDDHICRLAFADWLQEQGDPRADGYRALGANRRHPTTCKFFGAYFCSDGAWHNLGREWFDAIVGGRNPGKIFPTRRACEDAAALAFAKLASIERVAILGDAPVEN